MKQTIELPVKGMDCAECTRHVQQAIRKVPGVSGVEVYLASEKALIQLDPNLVRPEDLRKAVESAGYAVPEPDETTSSGATRFTRQIMTFFAIIFGVILFIVVAGEWLGLFETLTDRVPLPIGIAIVLLAGYPIFKNVIRAALQRQIISHTLMTMGVIAALAIGEWATAAVIVFFMHAGEYAESFTTERARRAVKDLTAMAPQTARVESDGVEVEVPVEEVQPGDLVIVRPGEKIPVDGEVVAGQAAIDQSSITGESLPVEAGPGSKVYAATITQLGSLRVKTTRVGGDTTFGRVITMVEQAEANRAGVQRAADKFSAYYLPVVAGIAALTYLIRRDPLATAAVLVVACSCSFALATPIAMLASIGAGARNGLLIKGGKYLEGLDRADILLIDKTGTLTMGRPEVTDIITSEQRQLAGAHTTKKLEEDQLLRYAASAERYSEHPLAEAVRRAALIRSLPLSEAADFQALPGLGVRAIVDGSEITIGGRRWARQNGNGAAEQYNELDRIAGELEGQGKTVLVILKDGQPAGLLGVADTLRPEVPQALETIREQGISHIELLTGDNEMTAASMLATIQQQAQLPDIKFRANLLPEEKIAVVKDYQWEGHTVVMIGDGVNDAPALAQADIGIAMGAAGADIAIEAAHIALMRDDWLLVPHVFQIARRTMRVVRLNIGFTIVYNLAGLTLAALGFLPPILAAAAQSFPDLGILANSSRLLRTRKSQ